jgi:hypothetical protein
MRHFNSGDAWADGNVRRAREVLADAHAFVAAGQFEQARQVLSPDRAFSTRQVLLHDACPPRRRARVWLGSVLLVVGNRLLRTGSRPAAPA